MTQIKGEAKIHQMIEMIKKEAKEESEQIIFDAKQRVQKEKNKTYSQAYDQLILEFNERELNEKTQRRLELSWKTNETRLDIQTHRNTLLMELKKDTENRLKSVLSNTESYKALLQKLMLEGAIRLVEPEIFVLCRSVDRKLIEGIIPAVQEEYTKFMKKEIEKDFTTQFFIITEKEMEEEEIGGVILYCRKYRIVFNNSLKSRLHLTFDKSIPDIRGKMFKNPKRTTH